MAAAAAATRIVLGLCVALVVASSALSQELLPSQEEIKQCEDDIDTCVGNLLVANSGSASAAALDKLEDDEVAAAAAATAKPFSFKPDACCKTIVAERGNACGCRLRKALLDDGPITFFGTADFCISADVCK